MRLILSAMLLLPLAVIAAADDSYDQTGVPLEVDTTAFRSAFDWSPPYSLDEGLAAAFGGRTPL